MLRYPTDSLESNDSAGDFQHGGHGTSMVQEFSYDTNKPTAASSDSFLLSPECIIILLGWSDGVERNNGFVSLIIISAWFHST